MHQHGPGHGQFAVRKTLAADSTPQKDVFENLDAPFGLCPAPLQALEFPGSSGIFWWLLIG